MTRCSWLCRLTAMLLPASVAAGGTGGTEPSLVPWPAKVVTGRGVFVVNGQTPICARGAANSVAQQLQTTVRAIQGLDLKTRRCGRGPAIELVLSPSASVADTEGYTLDVRASGIRIEARAGAGLLYGAMTAAQLLSNDDRAAREGIPSGDAGLEAGCDAAVHAHRRLSAFQVARAHARPGPSFPVSGRGQDDDRPDESAQAQCAASAPD